MSARQNPCPYRGSDCPFRCEFEMRATLCREADEYVRSFAKEGPFKVAVLEIDSKNHVIRVHPGGLVRG